MGFLDKFKKKAQDMAADHGDQIDSAIDKAADMADEKTGGKYSSQIDSGAEKAKDVVEKMGDDD